ncbi:MAG TPA: serine/threonine-protein kinase [Thermoanaerobaculia bacterium]|nr:serine/threonine-protein kinase [Thermoanaerobaculia bacterium]
MSADAPETLGPYRVVALLGRSGRAKVYSAVEASSGRAVALRVFPADVADDPAAARSFEEQGQALAALSHPNLLQALGSGHDGEQLYLVMEAFDGGPLSEVLKRGALKIQEAFALWKEVLKGLGYAHQHRVLHKELNPGNILVSPDLSRVKVTNFAISGGEALANLTGTLKTGEVSLANFYYLAPEQAEGRPADARSDIYAAGVIFHQMLTGRAPGAKFSLPSQLNPELPAEIDVLVLKCLARNPAERYANVNHLYADLTHLEEGLRLRLLSELKGISRSTSRLLGKSDAEGEKKRNPALLYGGIAAAVVVVLAIVAFLLLH